MQTPLAVPRGIRNYNPGNIERRPGVRWQGQASDQSGDPRFVVFAAPRWGIRAIARILVTYQDARQAQDGSKIDTLREIIARWAPATENDTGAYVAHVAHLAGIGSDRRIDVYDFKTMRALVEAIIVHENGENPYADAEIDAGLRLAGIAPPTRPLLHQPDVIATTSAAGATALATLLEVLPSSLDEAHQAANTLAILWPAAARWALPAFTLIALLVAAWNQFHDHQTGARE